MSTRNIAPLLVAFTWAVSSSIPLSAKDACAQAKAQPDPGATKAPQTDSHAAAEGDAKRDAPPAPVASAASNQAPGATGAAAPSTAANGEAKSADAASAAQKAAQADGAGAEATAGDASGGAVTTGSGLFEQSQSAAGSDNASLTSGETTEQKTLDIGGYARGDVFVGKAPGLNQGRTQAAYGELALKFRVQKEQYGDAYAEVRFRNGLQGDAQVNVLDLREAYVNGYFGPLDLRLGKQIVVWGRADAFNPTNNITPNDLRIRSPMEDDRRVGNIGARAFLNFQPFRLEGIWMPLYVASELPVYQLPQYVSFGNTRYPQPNLDKGLGAGRLHLELSAIEMSASFVHGYAPLPGLTPQSYTYGVTPPSVLISRTAYEQNVAGFDFSTAIGDLLGVRGEIAYRRPVAYQTKYYAARPDLQYVLGLDHTFGDVSVIVQYLGRYIFDWRRETGPTDPSLTLDILSGLQQLTPPVQQQIDDTIVRTLAQKNQMLFGQTERVQHMMSVRLEWLTLAETLSFSAFGLVNFSTREWLAFPKISYKISDRISTAVGAEIYQGPDGTLFGMVRDTLTAGYGELRYAF